MKAFTVLMLIIGLTSCAPQHETQQGIQQTTASDVCEQSPVQVHLEHHTSLAVAECQQVFVKQIDKTVFIAFKCP